MMGMSNVEENGHLACPSDRYQCETYDDDVGWSYTMRREMQEIVPGLFLGPNSSASKSNRDALVAAGITDLILVRQEVEARVMRPNFPQQFNYLEIQLPSVNYADIIAQLPRACAFLDDCFARSGRALVYCSDGISRGPAIIIGYLMHKRNMSYHQALSFVQRRRLCINLTSDLENQLREYEPICKARRLAVARGESSAGSSRNNDKKRPLDDDDEEEGADSLGREAGAVGGGGTGAEAGRVWCTAGSAARRIRPDREGGGRDAEPMDESV